MIRTFVIASLVLVATMASLAEEEIPGDGAAWNRGVDAYLAGDTTNAIEILRPLLSSETHAARAAEVVAKLEYDAAHALGESNTLEHLEAAASAAQIALRANPDDPRANANFTRATDGLEALRETAHVNEVLESAKNTDIATSLRSAVREVRGIMKDAKGLGELSPAERVEMADALEEKAKKLADAWIPVRDIITKNVTNEDERASAEANIDEAHARTIAAAKLLGDIDPDALAVTTANEDSFTKLYKHAVLPPEALAESLESQSNAWADAEQIGERSWQSDAVDYTKAFKTRFQQWADEYDAKAQSDTNYPPFTAEAKAKISDIAEKLEQLQVQCCQTKDKDSQKQAMELLDEAIKLMPIPPQPPPQKNKQNEDKQKQNQDKQNQNEENKDDQQQNGENKEENQEQEKKKEESKAAEPKDEKSDKEKDDEALLMRVLERSAEHKAEKQKRSGKARTVKDW